MKPNWSSAPEWANYAAQELSGSWYFHELKPIYIEICGEWRSTGRTQIVPKITVQAKDTLEIRPFGVEVSRVIASMPINLYAKNRNGGYVVVWSSNAQQE